MSQKKQITGSDIFLHRGVSKYKLERYSDALEDFEKITDSELIGLKSNNKGICYFQLGLHEEANHEYSQAIKKDPRLVQAYYNLAILHHNEDKNDIAKKLLDSCLKINRNFPEARDALRVLQKGSRMDWYNWWFRNGLIKQLLGAFIIIMLLALIVLVGTFSLLGGMPINSAGTFSLPGDLQIKLFDVSLSIKTLNSVELGGLALAISALTILLILPNIQSIKVGNIELKVESILAYDDHARLIWVAKPLPVSGFIEEKPRIPDST
jgi:tetratricopeptide (TPR) repeat protein